MDIPIPIEKISVLKERIAAKCRVNSETGCWDWFGSIDRGGYGRMWDGHKVAGAHRVSYRVYVGEIKPGLDLDHLCRNRACINPDHLEPVTRKVNVNRGIAAELKKARTHCPAGHDQSVYGVYHGQIRKSRNCRKCTAIRRHNRVVEQRAILGPPKTGYQVKGSASGKAKLTESQVYQIKEMLSGKVIHKEIAAIFGVSRSTITSIRTGLTWNHIQIKERKK